MASCEELSFPYKRLTSFPERTEILKTATALIYDAEPPREGISITLQLREQFPALPIFLFPHMRPDIVPELLKIGGIGGIRGAGFWDDGVDSSRLSILLKRHLASAPAAAVVRAIDCILARVVGHRPLEVARSVVALRCAGRRSTVTAVATSLGITRRTLERRWPPTLPNPKDFVDRVTLLLALYLREWSGVSWGPIALSLDIEAATLRRLRKRWGPPVRGGDKLAFAIFAMYDSVSTPERLSRAIEELSPTGTDGAGSVSN